MPMYLNMGKNEKILPLLCDEDYKRISLAFYEQGEEYFNFVMTNMYNFPRNMRPLMMNTAFTCELYLKSILLCEKFNFYDDRVKARHNLFDLFGYLSKNMQERIKEEHPCSNTKKEEFEISLSEIGNSFVILRYLSEYKEMGCNVQFLFELMTTLHEICKVSFREKI